MFANGFGYRGFRLDPTHVREWLAARRAHHPLLRLALGAIGMLVLLVLLIVGAVVGTLMVIGGLVFRMLRTRGKPQAHGRVLDGQYRVIGKSALPRGH